MNDKRNVIVMFLFVMLSFAIISEVSAASQAEADGTGFDPSLKHVNMTCSDFAGESSSKMQDHWSDFDGDVKFHNEQNSFNKSPEFNGDKNIGNENLYEHNLVDERPDKLPINQELNDGNFNDGQGDNFSHEKPNEIKGLMDNLSNVMPKDNPNANLRDNNFTAANKGEVMNDIMSNLMGLNNLSPNFKKDNKEFKKDMNQNSHKNTSVGMPIKSDDKKSSSKLPDSIKKPKIPKKAKIDKKSKNKKSKKIKKPKGSSSKKLKKRVAKR